MDAMQLTRSRDDRHLYALEVPAALGGVFKTSIQAIDSAGSTVGTFSTHVLKRGGTITWAGRDLTLHSDSFWKARYQLLDGDHQLARIEARSWGKTPANVSVDDLATIDPGLLLYAMFVVRCLAEDAASSGS